MQITESEAARLNSEIQQARRAKHAYDSYIKEHVDSVISNIYESIEACSISDTDTLVNLKGLLTAIRSLERSVLNDIDTGRMAEAILEKNNE